MTVEMNVFFRATDGHLVSFWYDMPAAPPTGDTVTLNDMRDNVTGGWLVEHVHWQRAGGDRKGKLIAEVTVTPAGPEVTP